MAKNAYFFKKNIKNCLYPSTFAYYILYINMLTGRGKGRCR